MMDFRQLQPCADLDAPITFQWNSLSSWVNNNYKLVIGLIKNVHFIIIDLAFKLLQYGTALQICVHIQGNQ